MSDANNSVSLTNTSNCTVYSTKNATPTQHNCNEKESKISTLASQDKTDTIANENEVPKISQDSLEAVPPPTASNIDSCITKKVYRVIKASPTQESKLKPTKAIQKTKPRTKTSCSVCRKRVGILGFDCRCGKLFCGTHRYYDMHDCTYDFLTTAKQQLIDENPVIKSTKLSERI